MKLTGQRHVTILMPVWRKVAAAAVCAVTKHLTSPEDDFALSCTPQTASYVMVNI